MVDFRYHLVSLISVFLALAVGIVLGAGPLRGTISDQLTSQVEQLRSDKEALRLELDAAQGVLADDQEFIEAVAPQLLADVLPGYRVAIVRLPGATDDVVKALTERVSEAGGEVVSTVEASAMWADPAQGAFRAQVADALEGVLLEVPSTPSNEENADAHVLAAGLAVALTGVTGTDATGRAPSDEATRALALLSGGTEPLVTGEVTIPADLVLVVSAPTTEPAADATADPTIAETNDLWAASLIALGAHAPTVVSGYAATTIDLLVTVRAAGGATTVDRIGELVGQVTVPLALAAVAADTPAADYGFGTGASAVLPPAVDLAPIGSTGSSDAADGSPGGGDTGTGEGTPVEGQTEDAAA